MAYRLTGKTAVVKKNAPKYTPPKIPLREKTEEILNDVVPKLTEIEKKMSPGGSPIQSYMGDLCITVGGAHANAQDVPAVSVVDGWPVPSKVSIYHDRTHIDQKTTPHVQSVSQSMPWGAFNIVASNKFNVVVGSGGISLHTDGCIDITGGGRTTISSLYEINMTSSGGNMNIICGRNINIQGDTVTIQTADPNNQVVVNSNLGIARNLTVHGSTYVDGELYVQHITAPLDARHTSLQSTIGDVVADTVIGWVYADRGGDSPSRLEVHALPSLVNALRHSHAYYTISSSLLSGNADVRIVAASAINDGIVGVALPQSHGGTGAV
jgi:hypothetical protein